MSSPPPSFEQSEEIVRALLGKPSAFRLEDAYTAALIERGLDRNAELIYHLHELTKRKHHADAIALARAALASGVEHPTKWLPELATSLLTTKRLVEAEAAVRDTIAHMETYKIDTLLPALHYHRARRERDSEAIVYHAGRKWFGASIRHYINDAQAQRYGKPPRDLRARFASWLEHWLSATEWNPATQVRLGHWITWFEDIGPKHVPVAAAFIAEYERRESLRARLADARDETGARPLVEKLAPTIDTVHAVKVHRRFCDRAPVAAFTLLEHAIANERGNGYRHSTGERVEAVISLVRATLEVSALASRRAEAFAIGRGYALVPNEELARLLDQAAR